MNFATPIDGRPVSYRHFLGRLELPSPSCFHLEAMLFFLLLLLTDVADQLFLQRLSAFGFLRMSSGRTIEFQTVLCR